GARGNGRPAFSLPIHKLGSPRYNNSRDARLTSFKRAAEFISAVRRLYAGGSPFWDRGIGADDQDADRPTRPPGRAARRAHPRPRRLDGGTDLLARPDRGGLPRQRLQEPPRRAAQLHRGDGPVPAAPDRGHPP